MGIWIRIKIRSYCICTILSLDLYMDDQGREIICPYEGSGLNRIRMRIWKTTLELEGEKRICPWVKKVWRESAYSHILGVSQVSANLYCNSRTSVLGKLRDYLRLLMKRSVLYKIGNYLDSTSE